jgi:UDP-glucose 4-epimerase
VDAIRLAGGRAVVGEECRGCGRCVSVCPQAAIELSIQDDWFVERSIARLARLVELT